MTMRRFAAVTCKPLQLLVRRFLRRFLRRFAAVPKRPMKSACGGLRRMGWSAPPYPLHASRRRSARAAGVFTYRG
jgi:hypothetical protein